MVSPSNASAASLHDAENAVKLIINLNHHLCARVTYVEPAMESGVFHVRCIKNIGGRTTVDYMVNGRTNTAVRV